MPTYTAYTGTDNKVIPTPPTLGAANTVITDPTFGSRILRVTDVNTVAGGYSLISEDAGFFRTFNADGTRLKLRNSIGNSWWMEFNKGTFRMGAIHALTGIHYKWDWSAVDPDILYYLNGTQIASYNVITEVSANLGTPGETVQHHTTVAGADDWVCSASGAGAQDTYTKIFCVKPSDLSTKYIDIPNATINGVPQSDPDWPTPKPSQSLGIHALFGSAGGQYLCVEFMNASWRPNDASGIAVLDLVTNTWELLRDTDNKDSGHVSMGYRRLVNGCGSINGVDSRGAVTRNVSGLMTSSEYTFIMQPPTTIDWYDAEHSSWFNSYSAGTANSPVLFSRYNVTNPATKPCWYGEIILAATDGSNTVWRFAHNHNGGLVGFGGQAFAQISNDGRYAVFSSPWGGTLGAANGFSYPTRIDTFIVELESLTSSPQRVVISWDPNTESDLSEYRIRWGASTNGVINYNNTFQISKAQAIAAGHTWTLIPANLPIAFIYDGLYYFAMQAVDTSGNVSALTAPQSKRVIRVGNKLIARK